MSMVVDTKETATVCADGAGALTEVLELVEVAGAGAGAGEDTLEEAVGTSVEDADVPDVEATVAAEPDDFAEPCATGEAAGAAAGLAAGAFATTAGLVAGALAAVERTTDTDCAVSIASAEVAEVCSAVLRESEVASTTDATMVDNSGALPPEPPQADRATQEAINWASNVRRDLTTVVISNSFAR
jgi:hypothetical protein